MFRKILVAYDGSNCGQKALERAMDFLTMNDQTKLYILHVVDTLPANIYGLYGPTLSVQVVEEFEEIGKQLLADARDMVAAYADACIFKQLTGNAAEEIVNYADKHDIDLIIIGSRGLGAVRGIVLGSVSSRVVQQATCNVLITK